jgi:hypothetical protein
MRKISTALLTISIVLPSSAAYGLSIAPMTQHNIDPTSLEKYGIQVHVLDRAAACKGKQFYISAPIESDSTWLQLKTAISNETIADIQSGVLEIAPFPERDHGWLAQTDLGFLTKGFRGVNFCLAKEFISRTTFRFISKTDIWNIGALNQWYNEP